MNTTFPTSGETYDENTQKPAPHAAALALFLLVLGVTTGFDPDILFLYRPIPY